MDTGSFPPETDVATIVVLPKTQLPSFACADYRPISLNTEVKIFAPRLHPLLHDLVHPDQCGFMPAWGTRHCIRRLHLAHCHRLTPYLTLLFIDFEKAFDTVDWSYLEDVLEVMGFSLPFWRLLWVLCSGPKARVLINGMLSEAFPSPPPPQKLHLASFTVFVHTYGIRSFRFTCPY